MINRVTLIGNLGQDPELKSTSSGQNVCQLRVATTSTYKDREGNRQEATEWHTVVVWGNQAKACGDHLTKGRQVYVEGRLATRKWTDKDGKDRYSTEVVAENVRFLGSAGERRASAGDDLGY
jgi:single-strand DNA-binding protein